MWVWYNTAPWWARGLVNSAWLTVWSLLFGWAVLRPEYHWSTPWPIWVDAIGLAIFGLVAGIPITLLGRPVVRTYATVLEGLTAAQRTATARALRRGPVPTDPAVLTAAVRASDLARAHRNRVTPTGRRLTWVLIGLFAVPLPAVEFMTDQPRLAVMFLVLAVMMVVAQVWPAWVRRRRAPHLAQLRATADADPEIAAAVAHAVPPAVPTTREHLLRIGVILVLLAAAMLATLFFTQESGRDCRTARAAVGYIADHQDLLDPGQIGPGGPALYKYHAWSAQLGRYADEVADPGISSHLHQISDLSAEAVSIVEQARTPGLSDDSVEIRTASYTNIIQRLVDADTQMYELRKR